MQNTRLTIYTTIFIYINIIFMSGGAALLIIITMLVGASDDIDDPNNIYVTLIVVSTIGLSIAWYFIRKLRLLLHYRSYHNFFKQTDGSSLAKMITVLNKTEKTIRNDFNQLRETSWLKKSEEEKWLSYLNDTKQSHIDSIPENELYLSSTSCKNCGATEVIRRGNISKCNYCGSNIN